jgi:hypothetical protein
MKIRDSQDKDDINYLKMRLPTIQFSFPQHILPVSSSFIF